MEAFPSIFTIYTIEPNLIDGYVHYTSQNGSISLATDDDYDDDYWIISER